jgi:hypothetical protein
VASLTSNQIRGAKPIMSPEQAVDVLNAVRHRGHAGWYLLGESTTSMVYGEDQYEVFYRFEAVASWPGVVARRRSAGYQGAGNATCPPVG